MQGCGQNCVGGGHETSSCVVFLDLDMHAQTNMCYSTDVRSLRWICKQILLEIVMARREIVCFEFCLCSSDSSRIGIASIMISFVSRCGSLFVQCCPLKNHNPAFSLPQLEHFLTF
jgi:hypothetical protein